MKILHLIYDHINNPWVGGGAAVRAYEINKRLARKGHSILVISGNFKGAENYSEGSLEYRFVGLRNPYYLSVFSYAYEAHRFLKRNLSGFDIVVEDFAPWNPVFAYTVSNRKPVVIQLHQKEGFNILRRYPLLGLPFWLIEKFYPGRYSPNVIFVSEESRSKFKIPSGTVIPNGINNELLSMASENKLGQYVLFLGRLDIFHKGLDMLVEAFENLEGIPLIIAGKGKDEQKLRLLIEQKGLKVEFTGFVSGERKFRTLLDSKFLVMPSRFEAQGIVALEAAAVGKPLIVSDIPELRYVVENGFGISFRLGDIEDLKEKIRYLWNNNDLIDRMSEKGRRFAESFTWDKIATRYEEYLQRLIAER